MARASKVGGKKAKAKARKASPAKGRKAAKTKRGVAFKRRKGRSVEAELTLKTRELHEALSQQAATAEVLQVISNSSGDLALVFDTMLDKAMRLCSAEFGVLGTYDGKAFRTAASRGLPDKYAAHRARSSGDYGPGTAPYRHLQGEPVVHIVDLMDSDAYRAGEPNRRALVDLGRARCLLCVPLLSDGRVIGCVMIFRQQARAFSDRQITLLKHFAAQAVIAIENARLINETQDALERQTATADILKVIASSPSDAQPVFEAIASSANRLIGGFSTAVHLVIDDLVHLVAFTPTNPEADKILVAAHPRPRSEVAAVALVENGETAQIADSETADAHTRQLGRARGWRSVTLTPLMNQGNFIGFIASTRRETGVLVERLVQLLRTFADQAVIAIENARLFNETRAALERQTATANILKVIASSPSNIAPVFEAIVGSAAKLFDPCAATIVTLNDEKLHWQATAALNPDFDVEAARAVYPVAFDPNRFPSARAIAERRIVEIPDSEAPDTLDTPRRAGRISGLRSATFIPLTNDGKGIGVIILTHPQAGFRLSEKQLALMQTFADQAVIAINNVRLFEQVQERTRDLSKSLDDLRAAQDRLIQTEKLASLGQLTSGIAHEIKNPLNFVNNFAALSVELTDELKETLKQEQLTDTGRAEVDEVTGLLKENLRKVTEHGKRADSIVKNMLLHSREGSSERRSADINALVGESLNLAYHGARAEKPDFTITLKHDFDPNAGALDLYPQEITRALLNLISNGFYAVVRRKAESGDATFEPALSAVTRDLGATVEVRIRDNGTGILPEVRAKMFNPFFTTKPTGEGTGLGLSMTHNIVVKQHGGRIDVETEPGVFTEFIITLPRDNGTAVGL